VRKNAPTFSQRPMPEYAFLPLPRGQHGNQPQPESRCRSSLKTGFPVTSSVYQPITVGTYRRSDAASSHATATNVRRSSFSCLVLNSITKHIMQAGNIRTVGVIEIDPESAHGSPPGSNKYSEGGVRSICSPNSVGERGTTRSLPSLVRAHMIARIFSGTMPVLRG
jgi:hypothetical protein